MSTPEDRNPDLRELEGEFGDVMDLLYEGPLETPSEAPSPRVWNRIAEELGGGMETVPVPDEDEDVSFDADASPPAPVVSLTDRRRGARLALLVAVAAAVLLVAVPLTLAIRGDGPDRSAELLALGGFRGSGQAELTGRELNVELAGLQAPTGSFYELWLLDLEGDEVRDLISLGRVEDDGSFAVPDGVDLLTFDVVDVSVEPDDGNPEHSGDSVLRGGLS